MIANRVFEQPCSICGGMIAVECGPFEEDGICLPTSRPYLNDLAGHHAFRIRPTYSEGIALSAAASKIESYRKKAFPLPSDCKLRLIPIRPPHCGLATLLQFATITQILVGTSNRLRSQDASILRTTRGTGHLPSLCCSLMILKSCVDRTRLLEEYPEIMIVAETHVPETVRNGSRTEARRPSS